VLYNLGKTTPEEAKTFIKLALVGGDENLFKELQRVGINPDELMAEAYRSHIDDIERFTKLIDMAEKRRNSAVTITRRYQRQRAKRLRSGHRPILDLEANESSDDVC
jgi:hypothetical protein